MNLRGSATGACGTPFWMVPELLLGELNSVESNVYAFSVTVWEVYAMMRGRSCMLVRMVGQ